MSLAAGQIAQTVTASVNSPVTETVDLNDLQLTTQAFQITLNTNENRLVWQDNLS